MMKKVLLFALVFLLTSCQSLFSRANVTLVDGVQTITLQSSQLTPLALVEQAGWQLSDSDRILFNGYSVEQDQQLPGNAPLTLQIIRAQPVTVISADIRIELLTAAQTVRQALEEAGLPISQNDFIEPALSTPITTALTINHRPAREYHIQQAENFTSIRSSAETVGTILSEGGIPLIGLDYSLPAFDQPAPPDGKIRLVRVQESLTLIQKTLSFSSEFLASADLEIDQQALIEAGQPGLAISRVRVRTEDGVEVSRTVEDESVVRPARNRIVGYGTKIVVRTAVVDGVTIEYWRVKRMYATSYSPCRLGVDRCGWITASGKRLVKGMVAMIKSYSQAMRGQPLFIPGYGPATIEDVGGGFPDGRLWIDLGFQDHNYSVDVYGWTNVYFLTPVPAFILWVLE